MFLNMLYYLRSVGKNWAGVALSNTKAIRSEADTLWSGAVTQTALMPSFHLGSGTPNTTVFATAGCGNDSGTSGTGGSGGAPAGACDAAAPEALRVCVEAVNQATMSAQTSGRIAEVYYDVDDYVEPGEPIVRFTDVEQQSALRQAKAALEEALARQKQADAEFRRAEGLFESGSSSRREYDQALAARDAAVARSAAARSAVQTAEHHGDGLSGVDAVAQ